jgi:hypothetical protein
MGFGTQPTTGNRSNEESGHVRREKGMRENQEFRRNQMLRTDRKLDNKSNN